MTQYLFLRHAEATTHEDDHERPLSENGKAQANKCKLSHFPCDLIVTSSAKRAVETATILRAKHYPHVPLEHVKQLYLPQKNPDIQTVLKMLDDLGEANLTQYLASDRDGAWKRYCKEAYDALITAEKKHHAKHILIVAHANIINDVGMQIDVEAGELRSLYFAPCTGFLLENHRQLEFIF